MDNSESILAHFFNLFFLILLLRYIFNFIEIYNKEYKYENQNLSKMNHFIKNNDYLDCFKFFNSFTYSFGKYFK